MVYSGSTFSPVSPVGNGHNIGKWIMTKTFSALLAGILLGVLSSPAVGQQGGATPENDDWTETASRWYYQTYWQEEAIAQSYTFTLHPDDKVAGENSVLVQLQSAAERPRHRVELRLVPAKPVDLSGAEAVEISLKVLAGTFLRPGNVYFCSPGFQKLAIVPWPNGLDLAHVGVWQRILLDLTDARILDKAKPNGPGVYDRHDVSTICLNFGLPKGAVDARLLLDAMRVTVLPPPPVKIERQASGAWLVTTANYEAVVGLNGYLQSLRAGNTQFLKAAALPGTGEAVTASACFPDNRPTNDVVPLTTVERQGRTRIVASGEALALEYRFRETDFDIAVTQTFVPRGGLLWLALSPEVVAGLDGRTDRALVATNNEAGPQIDTRLMTSTGAVLMCKQYIDGYSRMSLANLPGGVWAFAFTAWGAGRQKFTLQPVAEPAPGEALGFAVASENPDFLLPGSQPIHFDITATNYSTNSVTADVTFQVCDYLTRNVVAERTTSLALAPQQSAQLPTDVAVSAPGPYRGKVVVGPPKTASRSVDWVFTYDFPNYRPEQTRPRDFHAFWKKALADLAAVPMDPNVTPVPEESTATADAFKVDLATLNGRRVYCWYWKPKKPGRYPARFEVPSSGIYPRKANQVPHGENYVGMWMAIHGLPVDYDPKNPPKDDAAWNYWTHGIESPQTSMWRVIYASLVRGVDFLCSREEVDLARIMVSGGSQGGGLTMVLAGLDKRIAFAAPAHSGLARLDWTVLHKPGFWPFGIDKKPAGQTTEQFLKTLSYFDTASFTPDIACPILAEVSLLDTVTASGNQICALAHVKPGLLELICDPWRSHASSPRGGRLRGAAIRRWLDGKAPVQNPIK